MPALIAPGSAGQASTTAAKSASSGASRASSAPHSAPLWPSPPLFPKDFGLSSIPAASTLWNKRPFGEFVEGLLLLRRKHLCKLSANYGR